jgi:hypothetical protein
LDPLLDEITSIPDYGDSNSDTNSDSEEEEICEEDVSIGDITCDCLQCPQDMEKDEKKCCEKVKSLKIKLEQDNVSCILFHQNFRNIFNRDCHLLYMNIISDIYHDDRSDIPLNTRLRYSAYRTAISFIYGKLGQKKRTPVPSCIVSKVREMYPSDNGEYVGFKDYKPQLGS